MKKFTKVMRDYLYKEFGENVVGKGFYSYNKTKKQEVSLRISNVTNSIRILYIHSKKATYYCFDCVDVDLWMDILNVFDIDLSSKKALELLKQNYTYSKRKYDRKIIKQEMKVIEENR